MQNVGHLFSSLNVLGLHAIVSVEDAVYKHNSPHSVIKINDSLAGSKILLSK